jgi:hypothetical protein
VGTASRRRARRELGAARREEPLEPIDPLRTLGS